MLRWCGACVAVAPYREKPQRGNGWDARRGWLSLALGYPNHQPVDLRRHLDLPGQPRPRLHVVAEIEHVLLHGRGLAHDRPPSLVHIDMAGRAGASAAAFSLDAGNSALDRRLHDGRSGFRVDCAAGAIGTDIGDLGHVLRSAEGLAGVAPVL